MFSTSWFIGLLSFWKTAVEKICCDFTQVQQTNVDTFLELLSLYLQARINSK